MRNIILTLQYDGSSFSGYELQPGKKTVRGELQRALNKVFKTKVKTVSASRTDAGVHALGQVVSFEIENKIPVERIPAALNCILPDAVRVIQAKEKKLHVRYEAKSKEYEYLISNNSWLPPFYQGVVWQVKPKLDLKAMRRAAKALKGKRNFKSFCAAKSDDTDYVRTLYKISIRKRTINIWDGCKLSVVSCKFIGNGFLYKMVRNMVGTLVEVGLGKRKTADLRKIIKAQDRRQAGRTAPAQGLCLVRVNF